MTEQKKCFRCSKIKIKNLFHKRSNSLDGLASWCKCCVKDYNLINKEKRAKQTKDYYLKNKTKINSYRIEYEKQRRSEDSLYKFKQELRKDIKKYIKRSGFSKSSKAFSVLGLSPEDYKSYIQSMFTKGMSWSNKGEWHIDHIIPISSAKSKEEAEILNHHLNLKPLWAKDNLSKSNSYTDEDKNKMIKKIKRLTL
jgi:hypothetical protein